MVAHRFTWGGVRFPLPAPASTHVARWTAALAGQGIKDRGDHGPRFQERMNFINRARMPDPQVRGGQGGVTALAGLGTHAGHAQTSHADEGVPCEQAPNASFDVRPPSPATCTAEHTMAVEPLQSPEGFEPCRGPCPTCCPVLLAARPPPPRPRRHPHRSTPIIPGCFPCNVLMRLDSALPVVTRWTSTTPCTMR